MLRIERLAADDDMCFPITGRVDAAHVAELKRLITEEAAAHRPRRREALAKHRA
jgi:anti-anti-sigma regulatory factor